MLLYIILFIYYIIMSFLEGITNSLKSGLASAHSAVDSVGAKAKEEANKAKAMMQGGRRRRRGKRGKRSKRRRSYKGGMATPAGCGCGSAQGGGARRGGRRTRRRGYGGARSLRGGARSLRGGARSLRGGARRGGARRGGRRTRRRGGSRTTCGSMGGARRGGARR